MGSHSAGTSGTVASRHSAWLVLAFGAILSAAMVAGFPDDVGVKVLAMTVLWLSSVISVRMDLAHPFVWLGGTFLLYTASGPLLFHLGLHPIPVWSGILIEELDFSFAMDLQYMAFLVVCAVIGPGRVTFEPALRDIRIRALFDGVLPVLAVALLLAVFGVAEVLTEGFTQKIDVIRYGSWATRLGFGLNITVTCVGVYLIKQFVEGRLPAAYATILFFIALGVINVAVVGERNFIFRFMVIAFFTIHVAHRRVSFGAFLLFGIIASLFISVMGGVKMVAVSEQVLGPFALSFEDMIGLSGFSQNPSVVNDSAPLLYAKILLVMALGNEFMTAGNNLAMLVTRVPTEIPFQNGWTLFNDVVRALQPGFLVRQEANNTTSIYNWLFFPENTERGGGQGFSFVGTGYFNFGIPGVILVMSVFGVAVRGAYHWAGRSPFGLAFFLGFIPVAIQTARGDLSGPISQSLKHVLLPLLSMVFVSYLVNRRQGIARAS